MEPGARRGRKETTCDFSFFSPPVEARKLSQENGGGKRRGLSLPPSFAVTSVFWRVRPVHNGERGKGPTAQLNPRTIFLSFPFLYGRYNLERRSAKMERRRERNAFGKFVRREGGRKKRKDGARTATNFCLERSEGGGRGERGQERV